MKLNEKTFCHFGLFTLNISNKGGAMWSGMTVVVRTLLHRSVFRR